MRMPNSVPRVIFDVAALTTIRNAVVEAYPKESFGILYGERKNREFVVWHVQVMQRVDRTSNSVSPDLRAKKRIDFLMDSDRMEVFGSYHSHPKTSYPYLSKTDAEEWNLLNEAIQVVVSANLTRLRRRKWRKTDENTLMTRVISDKPLTLRLRCYARSLGTPRGYRKLPVGKGRRGMVHSVGAVSP